MRFEPEITQIIPNAMQIIAMTIFLEAANQGEDGMRAVASVMWNSCDKPNRIALKNECLKPKRYSCWNSRQPSVAIIRDEILAGSWMDVALKTRLAWIECMELAQEMVSGKFKPIVNATNYHARWVKPSWAKGMRRVCMIEDHIFYSKS